MNKIIKAKINSFLASDTSSSLPHLFGMSDNSYSLNAFKPECSSTWDCIWLLTVCLFSWNLIIVYKSSINVKSCIDLKFLLNVRGLSWLACLRLKQTKSENNTLSSLPFFYRLWHIFTRPSLEIMNGFLIDASVNRLW